MQSAVVLAMLELCVIHILWVFVLHPPLTQELGNYFHIGIWKLCCIRFSITMYGSSNTPYGAIRLLYCKCIHTPIWNPLLLSGSCNKVRQEDVHTLLSYQYISGENDSHFNPHLLSYSFLMLNQMQSLLWTRFRSRRI
jgi:hypothetical protein